MSTAVATQFHRPIPATKQKRTQRSFFGPLLLILGLVTFWALTLNNGIFIDESLYIRTGHAYIEHWMHGTPLPSWIGEGFSGHPALYPVLAGALDMVGGLALVRLFSLVCIVGTALLLRSISRDLFGARAGLVTVAMFGLTGPVLYVAHLGTFDALVILMLVAAWWLGMRGGWGMALLMVPMLVLAVATKYTAYVFVPSVLALSMFSHYSLTHSTTFRQWLHPHLPWKRIGRAALVGLIVTEVLVLLYMFAGASVREALEFTTTGRAALSPTPRSELAQLTPNFIWPIFLAAGLGLAWLVQARRWTAVLWGVGLIGTALLLPMAQIKLGEGVSFPKHLAYSAAFLAPLAGWGFARPWKLAIWTPLLIWWLAVAAVWAGFRSHDLIEYPDVRPVAEEVHFTEGRYLSSSADSLSYYTRRDPQIEWVTTFTVYGHGPRQIRRAVHNERFDAIIISAGPTGSTIQDEGQQVLLDALDNDSDYTLERVGEDNEWLIYTP